MSLQVQVYWEDGNAPSSYLGGALWVCQRGHLEDNTCAHGQRRASVNDPRPMAPMAYRCGYVTRQGAEHEVLEAAHALGGPQSIRYLTARVCNKRVKFVRPDSPLGQAVYPAYTLGGLEAAKLAQQARAAEIRNNRAAQAALYLGGHEAWLDVRRANRGQR